MSDTRRKALEYLKKVVANLRSELLSASKFFEPEKSWTKKETWWFDLPIKKIKANKRGYYYLLGATDDKKSCFIIVKVPNEFLLENLKDFETRCNKVRLHLAAYPENWLVDERGKGQVDFSPFEVK